MIANGLLCKLVLFGLLTTLGIARAEVHILVNRGAFDSVQDAAYGEDQVNFFDMDLVDERAATECYAAQELKTYLSKATNATDLRFGTPDALPETGDVFILGCATSNRLIPQWADAAVFESEQSYRIVARAQGNRTITLIEGADRVGTLYGVYRYLEELGVKFIGLGETGTVLPTQKVDLPKGLQIVENPSFLTRGYWAWGDRKCDPAFFQWMARNKMNFWTAENQPVKTLKKLGIKLTDGGHAIQRHFINPESPYRYRHPAFGGNSTLPADPYDLSPDYLGDANVDGLLSNYEAHPEWYALRKGKRSGVIRDKGGDNFCTSNADARHELAVNMVSALIDGQWKYVDVVNFWMLDYGKWCECDACKADGSATDKLFLVVNDVLRELKIARENKRLNRKVEITAIAYAETLDPPQNPLPEDYDYEHASVTFFPIRRCFAHPFADPSCTELNASQLASYQGWIDSNGGRFMGSMFIGEYYNISKFKSLPMVFMKVISEDITWYYENGARHFHYMHVPTRLWGTWSLNQYFLSKMLWNVSADSEQVLSDYFQSYYPTTAETTAEMYAQLEIASANMKILKHDVGTPWHFNLANNFLKGDMFALEHFQYGPTENTENRAPSMTEVVEASKRARSLMRQSLAACTNPIERKRLLEDQSRVEYGYTMSMYLYHIVRTAMFHQDNKPDAAWAEFKQLKVFADELKKITDLVQVSSKDANAKNGFEAAHSMKQYHQFQKLYDVKQEH